MAKDVRRFSVGNLVIYYQPSSDGVGIGRALRAARDARALLSEQ